MNGGIWMPVNVWPHTNPLFSIHCQFADTKPTAESTLTQLMVSYCTQPLGATRWLLMVHQQAVSLEIILDSKVTNEEYTL